MSARKPTVPASGKHIGAVNFKLATGCVAAGAAWLLWPETRDWWGLAPISIIFGAAALTSLIEALRLIRRIRKFERDQRAFEALGKPVKEAGLAEADFMTRDGVIGHAKRK